MQKSVVRIIDMVEAIGESSVNEILSDFSCEYKSGYKNDEVEQFLSEKALDFSRQKISITYLVIDEKGTIVGYFTLTHKPIIISERFLNSNTAKRKLQKYAKYDELLKAYSVSAFLIAQFGINFNTAENRISGTELMNNALAVIEEIQRSIGGGIIFLECEDSQSLVDFYCRQPQSFFKFGERINKTDGIKYHQLMRFI